MKKKYKAIAKIELHDLSNKNIFLELWNYGTHKMKIDGRYYYLGSCNNNSATFIEFNPSEHEIEICESIYKKDAKKVEHGEWINGLFCSVCGYLYDTGEYAKIHNYCPNCGAKMDGDSE